MPCSRMMSLRQGFLRSARTFLGKSGLAETGFLSMRCPYREEKVGSLDAQQAFEVGHVAHTFCVLGGDRLVFLSLLPRSVPLR